MKVKKSFLKITCLFFLLAVVNEIQASDLKFITIEVAPWATSVQGAQKFEGIFPGIVKELEKRTNLKIKTTLSPYARINRELEAGRQDCTILISEPDRSKITTRGELVFDHPMGVIAHKDVNLSSYSDLLGITISLLRGSTISKEFDNDERLKKEYDTDYEIALNKIKHGRLEAIAGAIPTIQYLAKQKGMLNLLGEPLNLNLEPIYLQCSNVSKKLELMAPLNQAIKGMVDDGTLDKIVGKFTL